MLPRALQAPPTSGQETAVAPEAVHADERPADLRMVERGRRLVGRPGIALLAAVASLLVAAVASATEPHVVQRGETLSEIAERHGLPVETLVELNGLANIHYLREGQVLQVDSPRYVVEPGDTLSGIAANLRIPLARLLAENGIPDPDHILVGAELVVPGYRQPATDFHIVRWGETLATVAARHGLSPASLARWNGVPDPDFIREGQVLSLVQPSFQHRIEVGDSLSGLAAAFGMAPENLIARNQIGNPDHILAGGSLHIPTAVPASRDVIGRSLHGREIAVFQVGEGRQVLVLVGGLHTGPEEETVHLLRQIFNRFSQQGEVLPEGLALIFVPNANPDGLALGTRLNARGVDLNRNWPTADWSPEAVHGTTPVSGGFGPLSEPETRALYDFLQEVGPSFVLSYHGYAALIEDNGHGAANELAAAYAWASGYEHIDTWAFYETSGEFIVAMAEAGWAAADVELEVDDASALERNLAGLQTVIQALLSLR